MGRIGKTDTVPAMLTPGEAVLNREAAELVGRDNIQKANELGMRVRGYADGVTTVPVDQLAQANQTNISAARDQWQKTIDARNAPAPTPAVSSAQSRLSGLKGYSASGPAEPKPVNNDGTYYQNRAADLGLMAPTSAPTRPTNTLGAGSSLNVHLGDDSAPDTKYVGGIKREGTDFWNKQAERDTIKPSVAYAENMSGPSYPQYGMQKPAAEQASGFHAQAEQSDMLSQFENWAKSQDQELQGFAKGVTSVDPAPTRDYRNRLVSGVSDYTPPANDGMKQLVAKEQAIQSAIPRETASVRSFTPSPQDIEMQRYDTVGSAGRNLGMRNLANAERAIRNPGPASLNADFTPGIQSRGSLSLAPEAPAPFEMTPHPSNFRAPSPGTSLVPTSGPYSYTEGARPAPVKPNWVYGDPNFQPQTDSGFAEEAKARARAYQEQTRAPRPGPTADVATPAAEAATGGMRSWLSRIGQGLASSTALSTQLASEVINNPMVAKGREEAIARAKEKMGIAPTLANGATVGDKEPVIDFSKPSVDAAVYPPNFNYTSDGRQLTQNETNVAPPDLSILDRNNNWGRPVDLQDTRKGEGVIKNATGTYGYRQLEDGTLAKFDAQGNKVASLGSYRAPANKDNPLARETEARLARIPQEQEQARYNQLMQMATNPEWDGSFTGLGMAKRQQKAATDILEKEYGLKAAKMGDETTRRGQDITDKHNVLQNDFNVWKEGERKKERGEDALIDAAKTKHSQLMDIARFELQSQLGGQRLKDAANLENSRKIAAQKLAEDQDIPYQDAYAMTIMSERYRSKEGSTQVLDPLYSQ